MIKIRKLLAEITLFVVMSFSVISLASANTQAAARLDKNDVQLVGEAKFSVMFWDIYVSRLYSQSGQYTGVKPSTIFEITYQRDISKQQLVEKTIEQWQKLQIREHDYSRYIPVLMKLWPEITKGDRLALKVSTHSSDFYFNDNYLGSVEDQHFSEVFLSIWLAPNTTHPKLRNKLIGR